MVDIDSPQGSDVVGTCRITRFHAGEAYPADDVVAIEEPLEIRLNGRTLVYLMRTPGDDVRLAAGYCISEGLVAGGRDIEEVRPVAAVTAETAAGSSEGSWDVVEVVARLLPGKERLQEPRLIATGPGGADPSRGVDPESIRVDSTTVFPARLLLRAPDALLEGQELFRRTGGTHGAGIFDSSGGMLVVAEDVGRHNAVDKAIGFFAVSGEPVGDRGLMLSGRLSYEMVLKAARAGIPLVCSVSSPTSLGIEVGRAAGVTLVGFLRGAGFNVYTHPSRIGGE